MKNISKELVGKEKEAFLWMAKNPDEIQKAIPVDKLQNTKDNMFSFSIVEETNKHIISAHA